MNYINYILEQENNPPISDDALQLIKEKIILIKDLNSSDMTPAAQIITMQERIISIIPTIRKTNPTFNPNMVVFIPENPSASESTITLAEKIESFVHNNLGIPTPNVEIDFMLKKTLPIYLENKKPDLSVMSPMERSYCLDIIKKYAPEYYATIMS